MRAKPTPKYVHIKLFNDKQGKLEFNQAYDMSNFFYDGEFPSPQEVVKRVLHIFDLLTFDGYPTKDFSLYKFKTAYFEN